MRDKRTPQDVCGEAKVWAPFLSLPKPTTGLNQGIAKKAGARHFLLDTFFIHVMVMWPHKKLQQLSYLFPLAA